MPSAAGSFDFFNAAAAVVTACAVGCMATGMSK
jgi:hypothetical protein